MLLTAARLENSAGSVVAALAVVGAVGAGADCCALTGGTRNIAVLSKKAFSLIDNLHFHQSAEAAAIPLGLET
jgi:hypothetical protein